MQVRVLGDLAIVGRGVRPIGGPTQRRSFALLVARRRETVLLDQLVDAIWPDGDPPDRAEHNVRTYVHRLRAALGDDGERIETTAGGYRLNIEPDEADIDIFEALAGEARRLLATGDVAAALDRIDEAGALWHGRPYAELADEPWALAEVARLIERHSDLMARRTEALLTSGRAREAVASAEQLVRDEPFGELPRSLLMRALYESGRHAEALRAFQEFRRFLIDDAGVEPSPDLVDLDRRIASGTLDAWTADRTVGNYELRERIGEGAFAVVHRATQASLGRDVAVKIIRAELANRPEFIRRFEAEARMVASIEHPNVVPLYDYWREPGQAFLVMRWMSGGSLERRLDDGAWTVDATVDLVEQIAAALDAAHVQGVVHRDVKPANILFDVAGRAFLGDFGIALAADERTHPEAALSVGSPIFAAPEQLRREPAGFEADVHALAIVAYTLLVGRTPFADAPDEPTLLHRQLHDPIPPVRDRRPELPAAVDTVLAVATAKDPADRYPTASGFVTALRAAVVADAALPQRAVAMRPRANPYKGLRAFDETDATDFHGREQLVDELVGHFRRPDTRMLALVGPSGSGKSSVVRAGLLPALRRDAVSGSSGWFTTAMMPGAHPFEALEIALLRVAVNPPAALLDQLRDGDRGILRAVKRVVPGDDAVVVVVIDQFEELFTAVVGDAERDLFLRALAVSATEPASPIRVILTLRADFYDRPLRHPEFAPLLKAHSVVVTPLAPDELEHAIVAPAAAVGVGFEPGLVAEIVADVNHEPGALPLLQFALTQAFDATDGDTITIDTYRSIGGLTGALGRRAEELHASSAAVEREAMRRVLSRLVALGEGTEDTRRRVHLTELGDDVATSAVLDLYGRARLLTFDRDPATREPTVEIAHEALIREWPQLRDWLDDDRDGLRIHRHLTETATAWTTRGRDEGELYRGGRLDAAATWAGAHDRDLNPAEREFLDASVAAQKAEEASERERFDAQVRANRRLRALVVATTVVAMIAAGIGIFAFQQRSRADEQADAAIAQAAAADEARVEAEAARGHADEARVEAEAARGDADEAAQASERALADAAAERSRAEANAAEAARQADEAAAQRNAADVERLRTYALQFAGDDLALLLAVEAHRLDPSAASLDALFRAFTAPGVGDESIWGDDGPLVETLRLPEEQVEMLRDPSARLSTAVVEEGAAILTSVTSGERVSTVVRHGRVGGSTGTTSVPSWWERSDLGIAAAVSSASGFTVWVADRIEIRDVDGALVGAPIARPTDFVSVVVSGNGEVAVVERRGGVLDVVSTVDGPIGSVTMSGARAEDEYGISILDDGSMFSAWSLYDETTAWALFTTADLRRVASGRVAFEGISPSERETVTQPILDGDLMYSNRRFGPSVRSYDPNDRRLVHTFGPVRGLKITGLTVSHEAGFLAVASFVGTAPVSGAVELFEVTSGERLGDGIPLGHESTLEEAQVTRPRFRLEFDDVGRLVVQDQDRVSIWNLDTSTWVELACAVVGHNMNRDQWDRYGPTGMTYRRTCPAFPIEH